jgi:hypothetical protein
MVLFTGLDTHSTYTAHVLPGLFVLGVGIGLVSAPALNTATLGVDGPDLLGAMRGKRLPPIRTSPGRPALTTDRRSTGCEAK